MICNNLLVLLGPEKSEKGNPLEQKKKVILSQERKNVILSQERIILSWLVTTSSMGNSFPLSFKHTPYPLELYTYPHMTVISV